MSNPDFLTPARPAVTLEPGARASVRIAITYCTQCHWLLRAAWMAQELLSTFSTDLGEVALVPGTGGIFQIHCGGALLWDRKRDGGFPDAKTLKQRVRDQIDPGRDLGHVDGKPAAHPQG
ncbi:SelT/SelW/SelH family protein [Achromobacter aloeverae]